MWTPPPLVCRPTVLYRGDTLTVDLPMPHDGYELGIVPPGELQDLMLLTFKTRPVDELLHRSVDKIQPVIAADTFARMKRLRLVTTQAGGFWISGPPNPCHTRVAGVAEPIFTKSGDYRVQLGPALGGENDDVSGECLIKYVDHAVRLGGATSSPSRARPSPEGHQPQRQ